MSNKDNLLNAGKKRALPPKTRNIPTATELPLSEEDTPKKESKAKETAAVKPQEEKKKQESKVQKTVEKKETVETPVKRGPGKPKKRKDGDKKISFWLDEDLVDGLFNNLKYGDSAASIINEAIREYQKKNKTYKSN